MTPKIGKYEIRERIGRGGMGVVLRAHDPVLDRPVALKVISDDVEVTDELRARFFREAQACAKLSHPNIVTVYDMGEDGRRLYIAMELLEGEELRRLIADRRPLPLEDKLALMVQICDGLHYAHQRGVIHRDIKPGNIIVSREGVAKIVDFGIAHMASQSAGLTRTGLVMGTLRYISPEQARGRVDSRSDMFSLASVFYEFLAYRPALTGTDPMELLEQLRSYEPAPLTELDPAIPADVSAVIARAMRKDPAERFSDLGQMRGEIETIQLRLASTAEEVRARIIQRLERARQLQRALADRLGGESVIPESPTPSERARLSTLLALESQVSAQTADLEGLLGRAEALAPTLELGLASLGTGDLTRAVAELETVLGELPQHERAAAALAEARRRLADRQVRREAEHRLDEAEAAFGRGEYHACLDLLAAVRAGASDDSVATEAERLRRAADAAIVAQQAAHLEELRRQRDRAEALLRLAEGARSLAEEASAARNADAPWLAAEARAAEGRAALEGGRPAQAADLLDDATRLYRRAEEEARDVLRQQEQERQRAGAARALQRMAQQREAADKLEASRWADALWRAASAKADDGRHLLADDAFPEAGQVFEEATVLYRRAEEATRDALRREEAERQRTEADQARSATAAALWAARQSGAEQSASSLWHAAEARAAEAEASAANGLHTVAIRLFAEAAGVYAEAKHAADLARSRDNQQAQEALLRATARRIEAEGAVANEHAVELWEAAETKLAAGRRALEDADHAASTRQFVEAEVLFQRAAEAAGALLRRHRDDADRARGVAAASREAAAGRQAAEHAAAPWCDAEAQMAQGNEALAADEPAAAHDAFHQGRHGEAAGLYDQAAERFTRAEEGARSTVRREEVSRERAAAEDARERMARAMAGAREVGADNRAAEPWQRAEAMAAEGQAALARGEHARAAAAFDAARAHYIEAESLARAAILTEEEQAQQQIADQVRASMARRRAGALEVNAPASATETWTAAEARGMEGEQASQAGDNARAAGAFGSAAMLYRQAEEEAQRASVGRRPEPDGYPDLVTPPEDATVRSAVLTREIPLPAEVERVPVARPSARDAGWPKVGLKVWIQQRRRRPAAVAGVLALFVVIGWLAWSLVQGDARHDAEQARDAAVAARTEAERVGASRNAAEVMERGRRHEQEGGGMLGRGQSDAAFQAYRRARDTYREAVRATAELRGRMDQARAQAAGERKTAETETGDMMQETRVRDAFRQGQRRHEAAEALASRQELTAAREAYLEAAQSFVAGRDRALQLLRERGEADKAHRQMLEKRTDAAKAADSSAYRAAILKESDGNQAYSEFRFPAAGIAFQAAAELFVAALKAPDPGDPDPWRAHAEKEREDTQRARTEAESAGARERFPQDMQRGQDQQRRAEHLFGRREWEAATKAYLVARRIYEDTREKARALPVRTPDRPGRLLITSNVAGVEIWVGNQKVRMDRLSLEMDQINPGRYPVKASRPGYRDYETVAVVYAGRLAQIDIRMERNP